MNKVFSLFQQIKQPWVLYLLLIVILSVLIWIGGPIVQVGETIPFGSPLSRLALIALLFIVYAFKFLSLKPTVQSPVVSPAVVEKLETDVELNKFQHCLSMAFKHLKKCRQNLPWHIVVGYAGSGKSQLLKKSSLEFPFIDEMQIATSSSAADIQIHINAQGIFIDVPGRFLEDSSGKLWEKFINVINVGVIRKNLTSIIVTHSLSDILRGDDEEKRRAYHVNQSINKLQQALSIKIPLYFVLTKADSLMGFQESFAALSKKEKEQVWGMAFDAKADFKTDFISSYETFVHRLNQKVREYMQHEKQSENMSLMAGFPLQMASLKQRLLKLVERLFFNPLFKEKLEVRGLYFTSAEQNVTPIDHLFENLNVHYGLGASQARLTTTEKTPYFVGDFFHTVILENALYHPSQAIKRSKTYLLLSGSILLFTVMTLGFMQWSYQANQSTLKIIGEKARTLIPQKIPLEEKIIQWSVMDTELSGLRGEVSGIGDLGFPHARTVIDTLYEKYHAFLLKHYVPLFTSIVVNKINANQDNPYALYQALKVYLMLAEPSHRDTAYIIHWAKQNVSRPWMLSDRDFQAIFERTSYRITPDMPTVADARDTLNKYSSADFAYSDLLYSSAVLKQSFVTFDDDAILHFRAVFYTASSARISQFYTPMGYTTVFLREAPTFAARQLSMDEWVLGRDAYSLNTPSREAMLKRMQFLYFQDYISHWEVLNKQLAMMKLSSFPIAVNVLQTLSGPSSPLVTTVDRIIKNTTLTKNTLGISTDVDNYYALLHQMTQKSGDQNVPGLSSIQANLNELALYLQNINNSTNSDEASFRAAKLMMANSSDSPVVRLLQKANNSPEPVKRWLNNIVNDTSRLIMEGASRWVNAAWKNNVYPVYQQTLSNRYPFVSGSRYSVGAADFNNFFGPGGVLDSFTQNYIQPFIDSTNNGQLQSFNGQVLPLSSQALQLFQQAKQIQQIQFSPDGVKGVMKYTIKAIDMSSTLAVAQLKVGDQLFTYRHDPQQFTLLQWPPEDGNTTVTLTLIDLNGKRSVLTQNGDWALTQFFKTCNLQRTVNTDLRYDCYIDNNSVSYLVHVSKAQNPLARDGLSGFRVPKELLAKAPT